MKIKYYYALVFLFLMLIGYLIYIIILNNKYKNEINQLVDSIKLNEINYNYRLEANSRIINDLYEQNEECHKKLNEYIKQKNTYNPYLEELRKRPGFDR